jgi:hypothetical protein
MCTKIRADLIADGVIFRQAPETSSMGVIGIERPICLAAGRREGEVKEVERLVSLWPTMRPAILQSRLKFMARADAEVCECCGEEYEG